MQCEPWLINSVIVITRLFACNYLFIGLPFFITKYVFILLLFFWGGGGGGGGVTIVNKTVILLKCHDTICYNPPYIAKVLIRYILLITLRRVTGFLLVETLKIHSIVTMWFAGTMTE